MESIAHCLLTLETLARESMKESVDHVCIIECSSCRREDVFVLVLESNQMRLINSPTRDNWFILYPSTPIIFKEILITTTRTAVRMSSTLLSETFSPCFFAHEIISDQSVV